MKLTARKLVALFTAGLIFSLGCTPDAGEGGIGGYSIGGTIEGLTEGTVSLNLNGIPHQTRTFALNGQFDMFYLSLNDGHAYSVTIIAQPEHFSCEVQNGLGVIDGADVDNILVTCVETNPLISSLDLDQDFLNCIVDQAAKQSATRVKDLTSLDCSNLGLTSVEGLEYFTSLTYLRLYNNLLTDVDLSMNTELVSLHLGINDLASIDLSQNKKLQFLRLNNNDIASLDLSANTALTEILAKNNDLVELNLDNNPVVNTLNLIGNPLSTDAIDYLQGLGIADLQY